MHSQKSYVALELAIEDNYIEAVEAAYLLDPDETECDRTGPMPVLVRYLLMLVRNHLDTTLLPPIELRTPGGGKVALKAPRRPEGITDATFKKLFELIRGEPCVWMAIPRLQTVHAAFILCKRKPINDFVFSNERKDDELFVMTRYIHKKLHATGNLETITQKQFRALAKGLKLDISAVVSTWSVAKPAEKGNNANPQDKDFVSASTVAESQSCASESGKAQPKSLMSSEIAIFFDNFNNWNVQQWKRNLSSPEKWLEECQDSKGTRGRNCRESTWWPVKIAVALVKKDKKYSRSLHARFKRFDLLHPWLDELEANIPDESDIY